MPTIAQEVLSLRIIHAIFLAAVIVYAFFAEFFIPHKRSLDPTLTLGFAVLATAIAVIAVVIRRKVTSSSLEALQKGPGNNAAILRWKQGQLTPLVLAEAVGLIGFALRFLGAPGKIAAALYAGAILLLLYFRPIAPRA